MHDRATTSPGIRVPCGARGVLEFMRDHQPAAPAKISYAQNEREQRAQTAARSCSATRSSLAFEP